MTRLPLAPLLEHVPSMNALAKMLGRDPRQLYRWRKSGLILDTADQLAVKLGLHPSEVWPEWWDVGPDGRDARECRCGQTFEPSWVSQQWCSTACRKRTTERDRYRALTGSQKAARLTRRRRYYEECGDYERAQERRRYARRHSCPTGEPCASSGEEVAS